MRTVAERPAGASFYSVLGGVAVCLLLLSVSWSAFAGLRCPTCQETECGFEVRETLECAELPANHRLRIWVTCAANLPREAFPTLVSASGEVFDSEWTLLPRQYTDAEAVYERRGEPLPVGEVLSLRSPAPQRCATVRGAEELSPCGTQVRCLPEPSQESDCCAAYAERGLTFDDRTSEEPRLVEVLGRGREESFRDGEEYYRFVVGAPDETPPPELQAAVECGKLIPLAPIVGVASIRPAEMSDITEVRVLARSDQGGEFELRRIAAHCVDASSPRRFNFAGVAYWEEGDWEFTAFAYDASGNVSEGPTTRITVPDDCAATSQSPSSIELECATPAFEVAASCRPHTQVEELPQANLCPIWQSMRPGLGGQTGFDPDESGGSGGSEASGGYGAGGRDGSGGQDQSGAGATPSDEDSDDFSRDGCGCIQGAGVPTGSGAPRGLLGLFASLATWLVLRRKSGQS